MIQAKYAENIEIEQYWEEQISLFAIKYFLLFIYLEVHNSPRLAPSSSSSFSVKLQKLSIIIWL